MKTLVLILFTLFFYPLPVLANLCESRAFSIRSAGSIVLDLANKIGFKRKKVSREDIKLPPPTYQEMTLQQQGIGPAWTKGLDKLNEWIIVKKRLKSLNAHPRFTHIQYFADQVATHLAFVKRGLERVYSNQQQAKTILDSLEKEAKKAILEERVTYEWWINFHYELSMQIAISAKVSEFPNIIPESLQRLIPERLKEPELPFLQYFFGKSGEKNPPLLEKNPPLLSVQHQQTLMNNLISQFPSRVAFPTTEGEIGIITINRAQEEGIYPLGLITQTKKVDGIIRDSYGFMEHDNIHASAHIHKVSNSSAQSLKKHKKMLERIEGLPTEKRKQAELVYFLATHESVGNTFPFGNGWGRISVAFQLNSLFRQALRLGTFSTQMANLNKDTTIEQIIETFMQEVYDPIF